MSIKNEILKLFKDALTGLDENDKNGDAKTLQGIKLFLTGSLAAQASASPVESADDGDFGDATATDDGDFGDATADDGDFGEESATSDDGDFGEETATADDGDFGEDAAADDGDFGDATADEPDFGEEPAKPAKAKEDPNTYGGKTASELVDILKANGVPNDKLKAIWAKDKGPGIIKFAKMTDALAKKWIEKFGTSPAEKIEGFAKKKGLEIKYGPGRKKQETVAAKVADALAAKGHQPS